jgi:hypothetical protein
MAGQRTIHVSIHPDDTDLLKTNPYATVKIDIGDDDNRITWTERVHRDHAAAVPDRVLRTLNAAFDKLGPSNATPRARENADALGVPTLAELEARDAARTPEERAARDKRMDDFVHAFEVAEAVLAKLHAHGRHDARLVDLADSFYAAITLDPDERLVYAVDEGSWGAVLHSPLPDDEDHCVAIESPLDGMSITENPATVAGTILLIQEIQQHLQRAPSGIPLTDTPGPPQPEEHS